MEMDDVVGQPRSTPAKDPGTDEETPGREQYILGGEGCGWGPADVWRAEGLGPEEGMPPQPVEEKDG